MSPELWLPLAVVLLLVACDRPCSGCGRWFQHRMRCPRRSL